MHRYDAAGNEILRTDSAGRETAYEYDERHHRIAERKRDGEGNLLKKVHPNAYDRYLDDGEGILYEYDSDGNHIRIRYPDGGCERMLYDSEGNRIRHVMPESYAADG